MSFSVTNHLGPVGLMFGPRSHWTPTLGPDGEVRIFGTLCTWGIRLTALARVSLAISETMESQNNSGQPPNRHGEADQGANHVR